MSIKYLQYTRNKPGLHKSNKMKQNKTKTCGPTLKTVQKKPVMGTQVGIK